MGSFVAGAKVVWHLVVKYWWAGLVLGAAFFVALMRWGSNGKGKGQDEDELVSMAKGVKDDCERKVKNAEVKAKVEMVKIEAKSKEKRDELEAIKKIDDEDKRLDKLVDFLNREFGVND